MESNANMAMTKKSILSVILSLSDTDKEKFCRGMLDLSFPAEDIGISYSVYGVLFDIAENYATNRNNAILEMIRKITTFPEINIKSTVRKHQKKFKKPSADDSLEELIIVPPQPNKFSFLDKAAGKVGQLKVVFEFSLTNGVVFDLSLNREKFNLNWETITSFINDYFKLEGNDQVLLQSFVSSCNSIKKKVSAFGKNKNYNEKLNSGSKYLFLLKLKKNVQEECQENHDFDNFHDDTEICKLEASFQALNDSVIALTTTLEETENDKYLLEKQNLRLERELNVFKNKHANLKILIHEKNDLLAHYGARNVGKRERRKQEKIKKMENLLLELQGKLEKADKKVSSLKKNANAEKSKTIYYKKKVLQLNSELTQANNNLKYFENLSVELQEEINTIDKNYICTFKNGKYTDEIRSVYYEMLQINVSVARCGQLLKTILKKMVNVDLDKVPQKSLAATMLVEIEALSKMQVFEETEKGDQNILHIHGTKYTFEEIGGFQVSTGSGSYTLDLENMPSGEAQTYLDTF